MGNIEDAIKVAVDDKLKNLLKDDLQRIMNKVTDEAIRSVKDNLKVKLVPIDHETFKFEFFWKDLK